MSSSNISLGKKAAGAAKWSILTQVVSKLISPVTTMILARLLTPEAFGVIASATMITSLADLIADAGFQKYLIQHRYDNKDSLSLSACVAFWTNLTISFLIVFLIGAFNDPLAALVGNPGLGIVLVVASLSLPLTALVSVQTALYQRDLNFKILFSSKVGSSLLILFVSVPLAALGFDYWSMVIGTVTSNVLLATWLTIKSSWKPQFKYSFSELRRMFSFGLWITLGSVASWINQWAGTFILGLLMSAYYVGLYKTSTQTCSAVMGIITAAILPIAFSSLSKVQDDVDRFDMVFLKMQRYLACCVVPIAFFILVYREAFTFILLGDQWGDTALFIGLWMFTGCISITFGHMYSEAYRAKGKPVLCVITATVYLIPFLPALWLSAVMGYECVSVVMPALRIVLALIHFTVAKIALGFSPLKMIRNVGVFFVQSALAVAPGFVVLLFCDSLVIEIALAVLSLIVYVLLVFTWRHTRDEAYELLDRLGMHKLSNRLKTFFVRSKNASV